MFANHISVEGLISTKYTGLLKFNINKINDPIQRWAKELNRYFSKEYINWPISI
jgi:hypothetical protein